MQVEEKKKKQANLDAQYAKVDEQAGRGRYVKILNYEKEIGYSNDSIRDFICM